MRWLAAALIVAVAGCSSSSSSSAPNPSTPTPTFTQLGTLAISNVREVRSYGSDNCPGVEAFPDASGGSIACDPRARKAYLLAAPTADERDVDATTVGREPHGTGWSTYLLLTSRGAKAVQAAATKKGYAIVFDGAVVEVSAVAGGATGGLIQIAGLSKRTAHRIAAALNPA